MCVDDDSFPPIRPIAGGAAVLPGGTAIPVPPDAHGYEGEALVIGLRPERLAYLAPGAEAAGQDHGLHGRTAPRRRPARGDRAGSVARPSEAAGGSTPWGVGYSNQSPTAVATRPRPGRAGPGRAGG